MIEHSAELNVRVLEGDGQDVADTRSRRGKLKGGPTVHKESKGTCATMKVIAAHTVKSVYLELMVVGLNEPVSVNRGAMNHSRNRSLAGAFAKGKE